MGKVKATRITLVVDEGWMEVIANHHGSQETGEVFRWESSEAIEVEVDDAPLPPVPYTITFTTFDIEPDDDFEIEAVVKVGVKILFAHLVIYRDPDEGTEFRLRDENNEDIEGDVADQILDAMQERVWEATARIAERRAGEVQRALLTSIEGSIA